MFEAAGMCVCVCCGKRKESTMPSLLGHGLNLIACLAMFVHVYVFLSPKYFGYHPYFLEHKEDRLCKTAEERLRC